MTREEILARDWALAKRSCRRMVIFLLVIGALIAAALWYVALVVVP